MRSALFTAIALIIASPTLAAAQTAPDAETPSATQQDVQDMADTLNNPSVQAAAAGALGAVVDAVLDIRVDKMAKALEPLNGGKKIKMKGNTVREIASRDDPDFERKMEDGAKTAVRSAGSMAQAVAVMLPELQKAAKKMADALPNLK